jgi:hypothetical protein
MINHQIWRSLSENKQKLQNLARLGFCSEHSLLPRHHPRNGSTPGDGDLKTPRNPVAENDVPMKIACFNYGQFPQEAGRLKPLEE